MGAAAIAARIPLRTPARSRSTARALAFHRTGGPLVAACGLAGGAGTTTLALLLARHVAAESSVPVLLTELAADRGGLAAATGRAGPASLAALARLAGGRLATRLRADADAAAQDETLARDKTAHRGTVAAISLNPSPGRARGLVVTRERTYTNGHADLGGARYRVYRVAISARHDGWTVTAWAPQP